MKLHEKFNPQAPGPPTGTVTCSGNVSSCTSTGTVLPLKKTAALVAFKEAASVHIQPHHTDRYLLSWLEARNYNVPKAVQMFLESLKWRAENGVDRILSGEYKPSEALARYYPGGQCGFDKRGNPIWIEPFGQIDIRGVMYSASLHDILMLKVFQIEKTIQTVVNKMKEHSPRVTNIEGCVLIFDMEGFGVKHLWRPSAQLFTRMCSQYERNYPQTLVRVFVIRHPSIFPIAYAVIKPFLHEETRSKIKLLGCDWKQELLEYIDADQLPVYYGGTRVDSNGDEKCSKLIGYGGKVPESMYLTDRLRLSDSVKTVTVPAGGSYRAERRVDVPGSMLRWEIQLDGLDIEFVVRRVGPVGGGSVPVDGGSVPLVSQRVSAGVVPLSGSLVCDACGLYEILFDNKYSWFRGKSLCYSLDLLPPANSV